MQVQSPILRAYEEKISAELQGVKARIDLFEAQAKEKKADLQIAAIKTLRAMKHAIDKSFQELKTAGEARALQLKADLDAQVAKLKRSLDEFTGKFKA